MRGCLGGLCRRGIFLTVFSNGCHPRSLRTELTKRSFCKERVNDVRELGNVWSRVRNEVTLSEKTHL